jgi:hypothetical protein
MLFYKINVGVSPAVPIKKGFLCFLIDEVEKKLIVLNYFSPL